MNRIKDDIQNLFRSVKILYTASPKYFIAKLIVTGISAVMPFAPLYLWRGLLNALTEYTTNTTGEILAAIIVFTILYCLVQILQSVMSSVGKVVSYKYNDEVSYYLDNVLIDKMSHIDLAYFDSSELKNKMAYISQRMQPSALGLIMYQLSIIEQIIWLGFAVAIVSQLNVILVLIIIALTVLSFLGEGFLKKMDRDFRKGNSKTERRLHYYNSLFFGNTLQDMKLFNLKGYFSRLYKTQWEQLHKARRNLSMKACLVRCSDLVLVTIGEVCAYISAINKLITGVIGVGDVTYYVSIASQFRSRLSWVLGDINDYRQMSLDFSEVMAFIEMEPLLETSGTLVPQKQPVVEFKNVSFHYPNTDIHVLKNCSFILDSGQTIGLVGLNGSGKSTIVKLLCRFYDPTEGQILIDHIDAREYDIVALRKLFGVLFQDYVKYSFTMRENISLSDIERRDDDSALQKACESSQLSEHITGWNRGIEENLTRRFDPQGKELSGGQWQRVSLARAFFRDAPIVLLDEPSAALDPVAEHKIFEDFAKVSEGKSAVLISHRLSSITLCDKILVLEDGHIIEQGAHKELLEKNGRYAYLFNLQASKYM